MKKLRTQIESRTGQPMKLIQFLDREATESYLPVVMIALISGLANSLLIAIVNHAAEAVGNQENITRYFLLYAIIFALFLYGQWYAYERAILIIEQAICRVRNRLASKVQQVELAFMEDMGATRLYGRLTQNDTLLAQSIPVIVGNFQMFSLMVFCLLYLGYISLAILITILIALGLGVLYFMLQTRVIDRALEQVKEKESIYFTTISHLVNGFKEIKINQRKGQDLLQQITHTSQQVQEIKTQVGKRESRLWGFGRLFIYLLLPVVIFIVPYLNHETLGDIFKVSAILLFLIAPTAMLTNLIPMMSRVNQAIDELFVLEQEMDAAIAHGTKNKPTDDTWQNFQSIKMNKLSFTYPGTNGAVFTAGTFDEEIKQGELLFIIGGNGSGKSTLLKLLVGLYYPNEGGLYLDGNLIDDAHYTNYRNLFSTIFTDFHLFDKFYGVADIDDAKVNRWLEKMHMQHKVKYENGGFTSTNLSTGQRKRLAFIAAMLEDKPILVMDEFAADQDPQFRHYFYEELLGEVKAMGKTIIAVTHDDHYFHVADRVWKMDEGKIELHA